MNNYENNLFKAANKLRGKISPSDYKFYVLPLVFLRYTSIKHRSSLWKEIVESSESKTISNKLDSALEKSLPSIKGLDNFQNKIYKSSNLDSRTISELINLIDEIDLDNNITHNIDFLGRIYEYFIGNFAATEGNRGGEFFTPSSIVNLLVHILSPQTGIVYDPACGSGGMFIQSEKYSHYKLKFIGQEQNPKTVMLAYMNSIVHDLDFKIACGDSLLNDLFPSLKADFVISNPPFNLKDWGADRLPKNDPRLFAPINKNNANYMWIQDFIYHLSSKGKAGFVISNGALTSTNSYDLQARKVLLRRNIIDCVVQLPTKMFLSTSVPSALIFIDKNRNSDQPILFIDASTLKTSISKKQNILSDKAIKKITGTYNLYKYKNKEIIQKGYAQTVSNIEVIKNDCSLMPSVYTGVFEKKIDPQKNNNEIKLLKQRLRRQIKKSQEVTRNLEKVLEK